MILFSELHDASSKSWIQLSSFTALVFLLLTLNCSGLPQVVGPSQPVLATVGGDVVLSCRLEPAVDASGMSIEWSKEDLDSTYAYVWSEREEQESLKHRDYKGRTSLLFNKLKFGDVSLKLSKVKPSDEGKYRCDIPTLTQGSTVELVVGIDPFPVISLAGLDRSSSSVELQCKSAGWYPKPEMLWLDADRNLLSAGPTETVKGPDGFYTVSSRVTVEKKHGNKFTCRVQQNNITHSREALIQVTDDFFKIQSSNNSTIVGLSVSLAAAIIMLILAVLFVHTRQKRKRKILVNAKQDELTQLMGNNSETNNQLQQKEQENETLNNQLEELKRNRSETENQLQLEKQKNEFLKDQLEELKRNRSETENQLQEEKQKNETLNSRLEELKRNNSDINTQLQLEKQKNEQKDQLDEYMETIINSINQGFKTSMPKGRKPKNKFPKLKLTGPLTVEEISEYGHYIRLRNISSEEIKLGGWMLILQINDSEPDIYTFKESIKLQAGRMLSIGHSSQFITDPDDVYLTWSDMMEWFPEDKLQLNLISNDGELFKLL